MELYTEFLSFYGSTTMTLVHPLNRNNVVVPFEQTISYQNNTPFDIAIGLRSGMKFTLPSQPTKDNRSLIIRVDMRFRNTTQAQVHDYLARISEQNSHEQQMLRESFFSHVDNARFNTSTITVDYHLEISDLKKAGGMLYYEELDLIFGLCSPEQLRAHPRSDAVTILKITESVSKKEDKNNLMYQIEYIDNAHEGIPKYANIGGRIFVVRSKKDSGKEDGIYITSNAFIDNTFQHEPLMLWQADVALACKEFGLFDTPQEASISKDTDIVNRKILADLEHNLLIQKHLLQTERNNQELKSMEKAHEITELKHRIEMDNFYLTERERAWELERTRLKFEMEAKAIHRKDSADAMKYIPAIIIGIGAIIAAFKAFKS